MCNYEHLKEFYEELGDVEFELLNLNAKLNNLELANITRKLSNILNRMAVTFGLDVDEEEEEEGDGNYE